MTDASNPPVDLDDNPYAPPPAAVITIAAPSSRPRLLSKKDTRGIRRLADRMRFVGIGWCISSVIALLGAFRGAIHTEPNSSIPMLLFEATVIAQSYALFHASKSFRLAVYKRHAHTSALYAALRLMKVVFVIAALVSVASVISMLDANIRAMRARPATTSDSHTGEDPS